MRRYIYIIIGIVVVAAIAILVLFVIKNDSTAAPAGTTASTTGSLPTVGSQGGNSSGTPSGGTAAGVGTLGLPTVNGSSTASPTSGTMTVQSFGVLSSDPVLDYFIDPQNNITAVEPTGAVITISNGQTATINSSTIDNIISASFSYDGKKILVSYGNPVSPQSGLFDVATNRWTTLPQGMLSPQWSPSANYQIAYFVTANNGKLALATIDASNLKASPSTITTINADDLTLAWPTKTEFIFSDKPTLQNAGSIWAYNSATGALASIAYENPGAEGIWSHDAAIPYGLVFFTQGNTLQLQAVSGNLPTQPLSLLTLPSKCAFNPEQMPITPSSTVIAATTTASKSNKKVAAAPVATSTPYLALYCGIPRSSSGFSSAHLPDDYEMNSLFTSDDVYKINTATGAEQTLWNDQTQNVDASNVKFFNDALFFVNRYDRKLYGLTFVN